MTMNSDIPQQGAPGIPSFAIVGAGGFVVPPSTGGASAQQVTVTVGPNTDGSPTSTAWMFAPQPLSFSSPAGVFPAVSYGVLVVVARPSSSQVTLQNNGGATPGTSVPAGAGISQGGPTGATGPAPATVLRTAFSMPAANAQTGTLALDSTAFLVAGQSLTVQFAGRMTVFSVPDGTHVVLTNPGDQGNAAPTTNISQPAAVGVSGPLGPQGIQGSPGPLQASVANPAALTALSTSGFLPLVLAGIQSTKQLAYYDPTSVATPDGVNVYAAQGGGNWISIFSQINPGVLGTTLVGLSTFAEAGTDWASIAAGQTIPIWTLPPPNIGTDELVTIACAVDTENNATPQLVSAATGNGVSPVVLTVPSTAGMVAGEFVGVSLVGGNLAANGGWPITVVDPTHLSLNGSTGNGAYTSGGQVKRGDLGHWERRGQWRNVGGNLIINAQGSQTDIDVTIPPAPSNEGPSLAGSAVSIGVLALQTLQINVTAPAGVPMRAAASVSFVRRPRPGAGPLPTVNLPATRSGPSAGGTVFPLTGTNFTSVFAVFLAGVAASFVFVNDGQLTVTSAAGLPLGGFGDIVVITANGPGSTGTSNAWTYLADALSIFGTSAAPAVAGLRAWYRGDSLQQTANVVTSWSDKSGNAAHALTITGAPAYVAADPNITPAGPAAQFTTADAISLLSLALGVSGGNLFFGIIARSTNTQNSLLTYNSIATISLGFNIGAGGVGPVQTDLRAGTATWGTNAGITNVARSFTGYMSGAAAAGQITWIDVSNGTAVQTTGTASFNNTASGRLDIGHYSGGVPFAGQVYEVVVCNFLPSSQQLAAWQSYAQRLYGNGV